MLIMGESCGPLIGGTYKIGTELKPLASGANKTRKVNNRAKIPEKEININLMECSPMYLMGLYPMIVFFTHPR